MIVGITVEKIGSCGARDFSLTKISKGKGKPEVAILCGVHGDEHASLLVAQSLMSQDIQTGTLHLFVNVNELAQERNQRFIDADLNRSFPGKSNGNIEERIAHKLTKHLKKMDLVIDIHCFEMHTPVTALQFSNKSEFVNAFGPEQIWIIKEDKFSNALGPTLINLGIDNFAIEMNMLDHCNQTKSVTRGIVSVLSHMKMAKEKISKTKSQKFKRKEQRSDKGGIFIPQKQLKEFVTKGDTIAEIVSCNDLKKERVKAQHSGTIMQIRRKELIKTGDVICAVGEQQ